MELNDTQVDSIMGTNYKKESAPFTYGPGHSDYEQSREGLVNYLKQGGWEGIQKNVSDKKRSNFLIEKGMGKWFRGVDWEDEKDLVKRYKENPNSEDIEGLLFKHVMRQYTDRDTGNFLTKGGLEGLSKNSPHDPNWKPGMANVYNLKY